MFFNFVRCPLAIAVLNIVYCTVSLNGIRTEVVVNGVTTTEKIQKVSVVVDGA